MERPCQASGAGVCFLVFTRSASHVPAGAAHRELAWPERRGAGKGAPLVGAAQRTLACEHRSGTWHEIRWAAQGEHVPAGEPGAVFRTAAVPITAEKLARRLITLIYAGRNRMDMIRRELPRTKSAGWVRKPYRIILDEGSPFRMPSAVIGTAVVRNFKILSRLRQFELRFGMYRDSPHEAEQFAGERGHDRCSMLAAGRHGCEAFVQPLLRFPGDSFGFIAQRQRLLSSQHAPLHIGPMLIGPCRFHQNPPQMCIAGLRDAATLRSVPAGIFAGHKAAVAHQLAGTGESAPDCPVHKPQWRPSSVPHRAKPAALQSPREFPPALSSPLRRWPAPASRSVRQMCSTSPR